MSGAFGVGVENDSFFVIEVSLGGLPPKGGVTRGKGGRGRGQVEGLGEGSADYGKR